MGSVKTNFGHLGAAAGVAGLIKVALALQNRQLPPSLNFKRANPAIDFESSPFYVQQTLDPWQPTEGRRIAGVSSFGIGGTNAHVVVEEAPPLEISTESQSWQLLPISAKSPVALQNATDRLAAHLASQPDLRLADAAFTLQQGRKQFSQRRFLVAKSSEEAASLLKARPHDRVFTGSQEPFDCPIAFMFPGQAAQYVNMGLEIYCAETGFRDTVDDCCDFLKPHLGFDLRQVLYPAPDKYSYAQEQLNQTAVTQPAMFVVEYALARLWMQWGIVPDAMIGHSIGEYVAACLAGVFSLEDALSLVAGRGRPHAKHAQWIDACGPVGGKIAAALSRRKSLPGRNQRSIGVRNSRAKRSHAGIEGRARRKGDRLEAAAHIPCFSFEHDGTHPGIVP